MNPTILGVVGPGFLNQVPTLKGVYSIIGILSGVGGRGVGDYTSLNSPYYVLIMGSYSKTPKHPRASRWSEWPSCRTPPTGFRVPRDSHIP